MKTAKWILILFFIVLSPDSIRAQEVSAKARFDTTDILIGDQIDLNISFQMPLDYRVIWPYYQDTLVGNVEIIGRSPVDTIISESDNIVDMLQSITITSFDSGYYYIPPLEFSYQALDDTSYKTATTIPLYLKVHTMAVDTTQPIKVIKPPLEAPFSIFEILPWLLMALGALLVTFLIVYVIIRTKRKQPLFRIRPKIILPPHVVAMNGLESLKEKKLWQAGKTKDYYTELTDILRIYIEERFDIPAVEMTTDEIMEGLKNIETRQELQNNLSSILNLADLVKFAKENPQPLDNDTSMKNSMDFVIETQSEQEVQEIREKIRIGNEEEVSEEEKGEGSSHAYVREDNSPDENYKEDKK